ncbi:hypothetical protein O1M63_23625 [Streptomyces mirabilis]|nr:hypothetical protein [Streptomyces mirabilis]
MRRAWWGGAGDADGVEQPGAGRVLAEAREVGVRDRGQRPWGPARLHHDRHQQLGDALRVPTVHGLPGLLDGGGADVGRGQDGEDAFALLRTFLFQASLLRTSLFQTAQRSVEEVEA